MQDDMKKAIDSMPQTDADPSLFIAQNGLRLRLRRVSQMVMTEAARRLTPPTPPRVFIEEKGREEENPNDPGYIDAMRRYRFDMGMLAYDAYFVMGTRIEGEVPAGVDLIASNDWVELLQIVSPGIEVPKGGPRRYLAWLKYHALSDSDQQELLQQCMRYSGGTLEADVLRAQQSFRGQSQWNTAGGLPPIPESPLGDSDGIPTGDDSRIRSARSRAVHEIQLDPMDGTTMV